VCVKIFVPVAVILVSMSVAAIAQVPQQPRWVADRRLCNVLPGRDGGAGTGAQATLQGPKKAFRMDWLAALVERLRGRARLLDKSPPCDGGLVRSNHTEAGSVLLRR
jgi:hypothetical protein